MSEEPGVEIPVEVEEVIEEEPSHGEVLGRMYKRSVLDCIVDLAYAVSIDFSERPQLYRNIGKGTAENLTRLQSLMGYSAKVPDKQTRARLYQPIFGELDGSGKDASQFQKTRLRVISAAAAFAENVQPIGFEMLRERIRSAIVAFRNHMVDLEGASFTQTKRRTSAVFKTSASILRNSGVTRVFGINDGIDGNWPLDSYDPDGAKLVEQITTQLQGLPTGPITRDRFIRMQRVADKGYESITRIVNREFEEDPDMLDQLTSQLYAWGSDLGLTGEA